MRKVHIEAWARDAGWRKPEVRVVIRDQQGRFAGTNRGVTSTVRFDTARMLAKGFR